MDARRSLRSNRSVAAGSCRPKRSIHIGKNSTPNNASVANAILPNNFQSMNRRTSARKSTTANNPMKSPYHTKHFEKVGLMGTLVVTPAKADAGGAAEEDGAFSSSSTASAPSSVSELTTMLELRFVLNLGSDATL
eukprot:CAMPEP_0184413602 /NCGR_PEP_ID=MMETSP0738-20130409/7358_1 /TAXON_ID=385413 /ORGANISM="Thalassiosira miniscula, Strain CCMP1093" /LENGTH=135 /DNA_ID=CAMNT_0026772401 /DNA_START=353 /DNA_END=760 /DNA_ORIENTATION=-